MLSAAINTNQDDALGTFQDLFRRGNQKRLKMSLECRIQRTRERRSLKEVSGEPCPRQSPSKAGRATRRRKALWLWLASKGPQAERGAWRSSGWAGARLLETTG